MLPTFFFRSSILGHFDHFSVDGGVNKSFLRRKREGERRLQYGKGFAIIHKSRGEARLSKRHSLSQAKRKGNGEICLTEKLAAPGDGNSESIYRVNSESLGLLGNFFQPLNHQEHHKHRESAGRSENNPRGRDGQIFVKNHTHKEKRVTCSRCTEPQSLHNTL